MMAETVKNGIDCSQNGSQRLRQYVSPSMSEIIRKPSVYTLLCNSIRLIWLGDYLQLMKFSVIDEDSVWNHCNVCIL